MGIILNLVKKLVGITNGWKSVIGWVLLQVPFFAANPLLIEAIQKAVADPTVQNISNAIAHLLLAIGIVHRVKKNLTK